MRATSLGLALCLGLCLAGCAKGKPRPAPLAVGEDACSECRMLVSQKPFAAQIVTAAGKADFFDDIGCLVRRARAKPPGTDAAAYVVDYDTAAWVDAQQAAYVQAPAIQTPMSSGIIAFATRAAAEAAAKRHTGKVLAFAELNPTMPRHR